MELRTHAGVRLGLLVADSIAPIRSPPSRSVDSDRKPNQPNAIGYQGVTAPVSGAGATRHSRPTYTAAHGPAPGPDAGGGLAAPSGQLTSETETHARPAPSPCKRAPSVQRRTRPTRSCCPRCKGAECCFGCDLGLVASKRDGLVGNRGDEMLGELHVHLVRARSRGGPGDRHPQVSAAVRRSTEHRVGETLR